MRETTNPSRDLLFGLLALQTGLIDHGALLTAFTAWTRDMGGKDTHFNAGPFTMGG